MNSIQTQHNKETKLAASTVHSHSNTVARDNISQIRYSVVAGTPFPLSFYSLMH